MTREDIIERMGWMPVSDYEMSEMLDRIERIVAAAVEAEREPATREQVFAAYDRNDAIGFWNYCYAWREAERFHGIRGSK